MVAAPAPALDATALLLGQPAAPSTPSSPYTGPTVGDRAVTFILGVPYGPMALLAFGVSSVATLLFATTAPAQYGVPERMEGRTLDRVWSGLRLGSLFVSMGLGLVAAALLLFPFTTLADLFQNR